MGDHHDYVALDWVKGEISDTLTQARQSLEAYVDSVQSGEQDDTRLRFCLNYIHQVHGTLTMVEFYGAALLAEEMEALTRALLEGAVANRDEALEVLMQSILQIPPYLEQVYRGRRDLPVVVMPVLNDLRAARGESLLSETSLFKPQLGEPVPALIGEQLKPFRTPKLPAFLKKLRQMYQMALVGYIKGLKTEENLAYLLKVSERLKALLEGSPAGKLWPVVSALVESLSTGGCKNTSTVRNLLRQVDAEIRCLIEEGEVAVNRAVPEDLLKNLLYYVARSSSQGAMTTAIKSQYQLNDALPDENTVSMERQRQRLQGPDNAAMSSVIKAVSDELMAVKDALDLYVRSPGNDRELVKAQLPVLSQVADTMGVLGLGIPRKVIQDQVDILNRMVNEDRYDGNVLMDVAGSLLYAEATLAGMAQEKPASVDDSAVPEADLSSAHQAVIQEARSGLEQAKDAIVDYIASQWDTRCLAPVPDVLASVRGGLAMIPLERAAQQVASASLYVEQELLSGRAEPDWQALDTLADAITGVEYFLERLLDDRQSQGDVILDVVDESLNRLGYRPGSAVEDAPSDEIAEEIVLASDEPLAVSPEPVESTTSEQTDDLIDDELLEVFIEEAQEVRETLAEYFPRWQADRTDADSLAEFRRGFHTLKGSGRMVGATVVGELAWSIENMLNRVIDGSIDPTDTLVSLVDRVIAVLPSTIAAFAEKQQILSPEIQSLMDEADCYSRSESWTPVEAVLASSLPDIVDDDDAEQSESDADLLDIFRKEAVVHLQVINDFIAESNERQVALTISDDLQRSLHTLKGSASMAGITPVADVVIPLEKMIKAFQAHNIVADEPVLALLNRGGLLIQDGLDQLDANPLSPLAGANELIHEIQLLQSERLTDIDEKESVSGARQAPKSVALFLAEGVDLLLDANDTLVHWNHQQDTETAQALLNALITVSDSAKRVDIEPLATLADSLIELYQCILQRQIVMDDDLVQLLRDSHEHLIAMMDQLAAQQTPTGSQLLLDRIAVLLQDSVPAATDNQNAVFVETSAVGDAASDDMDQELIALFLDEATDILEEASRDLYRWLEYSDDKNILQSLQRHLHTLKGGARMAGVTAIGDLGHELEYLYEDLCEARLSASQELINLLLRTHDTLDEMLSQLRSNNVCRSAEDLRILIHEFRDGKTDDDLPTEEMQENRQPLAPEPVSVALPDGLDPEMAGIFLEEATDLLEQVEEQMAAWQSDTADMMPAEELMRALHTLKGSARMAGLVELGDASHQMEVVVEGLQQKGSISKGEIRELATNAEQLQRLVENVASSFGQSVEPSTTAPVPEASDASESVEAERKIADVLSFPQPDDNQVSFIKAPAFLASGQARGNNAVEMSAREMVRVPAELLEQLVNLAGETSISRARIEQQISDFSYTLQEMHDTIERLREQLRRLDIETQSQILSRHEGELADHPEFDPLEMDQYSELTQLSRSLVESATDLMDLKDALADRNRDSETLITQQARINTELQEGLMRTRMVPFSRLLPRLRRIVRQVSSELGKDVELKVENAEGEMDRSVMERMLAPLEHMLRNAVDHGIESADERTRKGKPATGQISLVFGREGGDIVLSLRDDGKGLNPDAIREKALARGLLASGADVSDADVTRLILEPGFSTAEKVTQISGRGVGLDVVNSELKQLGGRLDIHSDQDAGTTFEVRLPFTLSVNRALMVNQGEEVYAVPLNTIEGIVRVSPEDLQAGYDSGLFEYAGSSYRLHYLGEMFGKGQPSLSQMTQDVPVLLVHSGDTSVALQIDGLSASREIVVKSLGPQFAKLPGISGATILGDGRVVIILDVVALALRTLARTVTDESKAAEPVAVLDSHEEKALIMVVDDSVTVRKVTTRLLGRHGYDTLVARDGVEAMALLQDQRPDLILLDIEMPRMDGFEVATAVRNDPALSGIPIIMITSRTGTKHRQRAMEIGVNDYMGKPFQEGPLLEAIEGLVSVYG
ncbi:Hpt domain-containing protein [Kistimonas scapharcae]|uniref:histidine kinase n=1 Tax=Kistimonas scapharcae TaxID=1036133 RepID=A0ABP8V974_9GAMM